MANGQIATATAVGGATGLAGGPIGAALGAAAGYVSASGILGGHKKKETAPVPWYKKPGDLELVLVGSVVVLLLVWAIEKKKAG